MIMKTFGKSWRYYMDSYIFSDADYCVPEDIDVSVLSNSVYLIRRANNV
jgi:hypothetical protein